MGKTTISPLLELRLKKATWWQRRKFWWAFARYDATCSMRERSVGHLDCGRDMADLITGGRATEADRKVDAARERLAAIIQTLPEVNP